MTTRFASGREILVGRGIPQPVPIALDPAAYAGALVYGSDARFYRSNGTAWLLEEHQVFNTDAPNETVPVMVVRPDPAQNTSASIDVAVAPRNEGALVAGIPDNTVAGGNKRGSWAVDLQMTRVVASQVASSNGAVICGGAQNTASGAYSTVGGGEANTAAGDQSAIGGGAGNNTLGQYATIGGGYTNVASGAYSTVGGGADNAASGFGSVIAGGYGNVASGTYSTVGGGSANVSSGAESVIAGGSQNYILSARSVISGGHNNICGYSDYGTIGGGWDNVADGYIATIGGGNLNIASGVQSTVGGGLRNTASGMRSTVPGGANADTRGVYGRLAYAAGSFNVESQNAERGTAQYGLHVLFRATTNATQIALIADAIVTNNPSPTNIPALPNNSLYAFRIRVVCIQTGGTAGAARDSKAWDVAGAIKRGANAAATALLGTPTITVLGADANLGADNTTGAVIAIAADTTNGGLRINVTGQANKNLRWVATVETTEVAY